MLKSGRICDIICLSVFSVREEVEAVIYIINLVVTYIIHHTIYFVKHFCTISFSSQGK